jgi:murein DD-endopeptidase MepM/ murein hydrolase activator NlpD
VEPDATGDFLQRAAQDRLSDRACVAAAQWRRSRQVRRAVRRAAHVVANEQVGIDPGEVVTEVAGVPSRLARLGDRDPRVLSEYGSESRRGVELGYATSAFDSKLFVPVHAVQAGEIAAALDVAAGYAITIDHGDRTMMTHYAHLSRMFVTPCIPKSHVTHRQFIHAGEVIGYASKSHVRFELLRWTNDRGYVAIDPIPEMITWTKALTPVDVRELAKEARSYERCYDTRHTFSGTFTPRPMGLSTSRDRWSQANEPGARVRRSL